MVADVVLEAVVVVGGGCVVVVARYTQRYGIAMMSTDAKFILQCS